ncbi:MAG: EAL domain-containing protein [Acidimicrobiales bacterium]|nr:EAL domain-containing protein [Acidimicrobiales bacterium]
MLRVVVDETVDSIARFDRRLRYDFVNDRTAQLSGLAVHEWIGRTHAEMGFGDDQAELREDRIRKVFATAEKATYQDSFGSGERERWFETTLIPQVDDHGGVEHVIMMSRDITSRKLAENALIRAAARDPLTGLANRTALLDVLEQAVRASFDSTFTTAVLLVDLDRFKLVNDSLGHAVGDRLLCLAAERLVENVRPGDLVARHGGDEFVVVMRHLPDPAEAVHVALRVVEAFRRPLLSGETELSATASVGISVTSASRDQVDANDLLREADTAMYVAKANGRDGVSVFDETLRTAIDERLRLENQLRGALPRDELEVWYQPEVSLANGTIRAAEALLRWRHPSGEVYPAARFIEIAEESGLIVPIGNSVLETVCRQAAEWNRHDILLRMNLAPRQLDDPDLLARFHRAIDATGCRPEQLCVEITESALLHDTPAAASNLEGLSAIGVSIALDDFGTGYASLTYLRRYHIDVVKLDRSFVTDIATSDRDRRLTAAVVAMADKLEISVTAEGVETAEQAELVRSLGCEGAQGYLYSPAVPAADHEQMLQTGAPLRA